MLQLEDVFLVFRLVRFNPNPYDSYVPLQNLGINNLTSPYHHMICLAPLSEILVLLLITDHVCHTNCHAIFSTYTLYHVRTLVAKLSLS
jgi:hypothetical protein